MVQHADLDHTGIASGLVVIDESTTAGTAHTLKVVGGAATVAVSGGTATLTDLGVVVLDDGSAVGTAAILNFTNGTATYAGGTATINLASGAGVPFDEDLLPWIVDVEPKMNAITNTNWSTLTHENSAPGSWYFGGTKDSTAAQNAEIGWDIVLAAGTWTFELMHRAWSDRGIYTVSLDGGSIGTIDGYNASDTPNTISSITGIAVATSGKTRLLLKMATKNASSSNYRGSLQHVQFRRTA